MTEDDMTDDDGKTDESAKSNGKDGPLMRRLTPDEQAALEFHMRDEEATGNANRPQEREVDVTSSVHTIIKETGGYLMDIGGVMIRANVEEPSPLDHHQTIQALMMINAQLARVTERLVILRLMQERRDQDDLTARITSGDLESSEVSKELPKGDLKGVSSKYSLLGAEDGNPGFVEGNETDD